MLDGRGFVLLRGLPVDRYSREDVAVLYWGMGVHLGYPVVQNSKGHLLGHVTNLGDNAAEAPREETSEKPRIFLHPQRRGYSTRGRAYFHVDPCDIVGLLCLHPARSGGQSLVVSSVAIHNEIMKRRPDLLRVLYQPFWTSRQNEIPAGAKPYFQMPMFSYHQGKLTTFFTPGFVRNSENFPELPRPTDDQRAALDLVEEISNEPMFHLSMMLEKGDIQFLHNHVLLHTRTEYEDFDGVDRRRHLARLWLVTPESRPLPHWIYDCTGGGRRGGIYVPGVKEIASIHP